MSPEEQVSLDNMKVMVEEVKSKSFDHMLHLIDMSETELRNCGFKSVGEGLRYMMNEGRRKIKKLQMDHLQKYPD